MSKENQKKEMRQHYHSILKARASELPLYQAQLTENLKLYLQEQKGTWASYRSIHREPKTELAITQVTAQVTALVTTKQRPHQINWSYPRISGNFLEFYLGTEFEELELSEQVKLTQPKEIPENKVSPRNMNGLLIPGVAFDLWGGRLGRGKGYYDRTLANFEGKKVGISFSFLISTARIPCESHDIKMHMVITDEGVFNCNKE